MSCVCVCVYAFGLRRIRGKVCEKDQTKARRKSPGGLDAEEKTSAQSHQSRHSFVMWLELLCVQQVSWCTLCCLILPGGMVDSKARMRLWWLACGIRYQLYAFKGKTVHVWCSDVQIPRYIGRYLPGRPGSLCHDDLDGKQHTAKKIRAVQSYYQSDLPLLPVSIGSFILSDVTPCRR